METDVAEGGIVSGALYGKSLENYSAIKQLSKIFRDESEQPEIRQKLIDAIGVKYAEMKIGVYEDMRRLYEIALERSSSDAKWADELVSKLDANMKDLGIEEYKTILAQADVK